MAHNAKQRDAAPSQMGGFSAKTRTQAAARGDVKSIAVAAQLNDLFARLSLHGVRAWPTNNAESVLVQYRSESHGNTRTVSCEARPLVYWLNERALQPGCRPRFEAILDRKPEWHGTMRQQELDLGDSPAIVKRSMRHFD